MSDGKELFRETGTPATLHLSFLLSVLKDPLYLHTPTQTSFRLMMAFFPSISTSSEVTYSMGLPTVQTALLKLQCSGGGQGSKVPM